MKPFSLAIATITLMSAAKFLLKNNMPVSGWVCLGFGCLMCLFIVRSR
jgi:hypothetical protein